MFLLISSVLNGRSLTDQLQLSLSEQKWCFLSNGATRCLQSIYRFKHRLDIRCLNGGSAFSGRYLIMQQHNQNSRLLQLILSRTWNVKIITAESKYITKRHPCNIHVLQFFKAVKRIIFR